MEVIEIKLSRLNNKLTGVKLIDNESWIVLNDNPGDYILDGYRFVNKKFIKQEKKLLPNNIKDKILILKFQYDMVKQLETIPTNSYKSLFSYLKEKSVLVEISLDKDECILVGKIVNVFEKSFEIEKISTKATILGIENLKFSIVRSVGLKTDYLNSLELYLNTSDIE